MNTAKQTLLASHLADVGNAGKHALKAVELSLIHICTVIGGNTVDRGLIELEVARVDDGAGRGLQEHAERARCV